MSLTSLTPKTLLSGASQVGGGDPSLIPRLDGKVLIIKDFTSILSMHYASREEILGALRDAFDGKTSRGFGTGVIRSYESTFGLIAGVTPAIEMFSKMHSSLGERFLRYRIPFRGTINVGEDIIAMAIANISREEDMRSDLCCVADEALNVEVTKEEMPTMPPAFAKRIVGLAQYVASLRATVVREKYTREMQFKPVAEIGTRLAKQLGKLAFGLGIFYRTEELGEEQYKIVVKAARDTIPDMNEEIIKKMWMEERDGFITANRVAELTRLSPGTCRTIMQDLTLLRVLKRAGVGGANVQYKIGPAVARIIKNLEIYKEEEEWQEKMTGKRKRKRKRPRRRKR
jgi:hypothetical protein